MYISGAIKFGDEITRETCEKLLKSLSKCDLPFQCAHGRPTLTIVANLDEMNIVEQVRPLVGWSCVCLFAHKFIDQVMPDV